MSKTLRTDALYFSLDAERNDDGWAWAGRPAAHFRKMLEQAKSLELALASAEESIVQWRDNLSEANKALARRDELLREVVEWLDSPPVQASLRRAAELNLTHPHLAVSLSKEFSARAADMWKRVRAELVEGK